jgi:O-succinylbenzoate synthase
MKIFAAKYMHEPLPGKKMEGALLRVMFGAFCEGFADIHPWVEFGDAPLNQQFSTPNCALLAKSLYFASIDAQARTQSRNLLEGLDLPLSHALVNLTDRKHIEAKLENGFTHFKVKMGDDLSAETKVLESLPMGKWRIDFNGKLTLKLFTKWWNSLSEQLHKRVDMIEDPFSERESAEKMNIVFSDWIVNPKWSGRVFKPARDFPFAEPRAKRVVFTHSLDHPLGQITALWEAANYYRRYPTLKDVCGFSEVRGFEEFYARWSCERPRRRPAPGKGFGFDELLHSQKWERIV